MRTIYAALCISALALTAGCHSITPNVSAVVKPPAPPTNVEPLRLGPPPTDFKSEFGDNGQRSNRQIAVSIQTYKVSQTGLFSRKISWETLPKGKQGSEDSGKGIISQDAGMKILVLKVDSAFAKNGLFDFLQSQGKTTLSSSSTIWSLDGVVTPFSTANKVGYLSQLQCKAGESVSLAPGSAEHSREYTITPKIVDDNVVFLSLDLLSATTSSEPSTCNDKNEPDDLVQAKEGSIYSVSSNLSANEALIIAGIEDAETEKDGSLKIAVVTAKEVKEMDQSKKAD